MALVHLEGSGVCEKNSLCCQCSDLKPNQGFPLTDLDEVLYQELGVSTPGIGVGTQKIR